ncbi:MAG: SLC13 family permease, partial [Crocinitomicaceae bacterium]|nr:SLC13 family permease [Crocinitomicaceae bacterium]
MKSNTIHLLITLVISLFTLIITGGENTFVNAILMGGVMVYLWITEAIPIYVTALIPFIFGVPLGVIDTKQLALSYGDKNVFLFLGGFILALALEKWHVHTQVARAIIHAVGFSKPRLLLGFLLSTAFLSMWISNTATTLMMLPMAMAIISVMPKKEQKSQFAVLLLLCIAYGASIGGMATLVGSPPNIQMAGILEQNFGVVVDFGSWMKIGLPTVLVLLGVTFAYMFLRLGKEERSHQTEVNLEKAPWTINQKRTVFIFTVVVILWSFKSFISELTGINLRDEGAALLVALFLFIVTGEKEKQLLNRKETEKLPWG